MSLSYGKETAPSPQEIVVVRGVIGAGRDYLDQPRSYNAFFGFSLDKTISRKHLAMYLEWALEHSRHCPVIVDDMEFRHNYTVFNGLSEKAATSRASLRGLELAEQIAGAIATVTYRYEETFYRKANPDDHRAHAMNVSRSSTYYFNPIAVHYLDHFLQPLIQEYEKNTAFKEDVDAQVDRSVGKRLTPWRTRVSQETYLAGREKLARFVLEETAVTMAMVERGYNVEFYAGQPIQVVVDTYNTDNYPELRRALNLRAQYGHISLGIERIKSPIDITSRP